MTAQILDGKTLAAQIKQTIKQTITTHLNEGKQAPGLAVILVGHNPASEVYVHNKQRACKEVGIHSSLYHLPENSSEHEVIELICSLNQDPTVDGILLQLPLPPSMNSTTIIEHLAPEKDVDGFHPYNMGRLVLRAPRLRPCTPYGIIQLLKAHHIPLEGKHAVIVGASNIVGRPMTMEFALAKSTATLSHRFTHNLEKHVRSADILVVATGKRGIIDAQWLHENQVVVDVGIHRFADNSIHGDVDFEYACEKVAWITPVPGGVGPMTIAALLQNTLQAAQEHRLGCS